MITRLVSLPHSLTFSSDNLILNDPLFEGRLELATEGLEPSYFNKLKKLLSKTNALTIANYILAMKTEINLSDSYRMIILKALVGLSQFFRNEISFQTIGRKEILMFLDSYRKTDTTDPLHKWIGTYNLLLVTLVRFFKWLYFPDLPVNVFSKDILMTHNRMTILTQTWRDGF